MLLDDVRTITAFRKVLQLRDEIKAYCLAPDRPDLPVEDFQAIVTRMYGVAIKKFEVPFEGTFLRGMIERYPSRAVIYVKKNMEEDWKRFAAVKEMCHIVNDEREDWSIDGASTIRKMLAEYHIRRDRLVIPAVQSEVLAEITAIEILYPYEERLRDIDSVSGSGNTIAQIASFYKIPEVIVAQALSDWYHDMARTVWEQVAVEVASELTSEPTT